MSTNRGIKEWSAVLNAMGQGKQSLLVRIYEPLSDTEFERVKTDILRVVQSRNPLTC